MAKGKNVNTRKKTVNKDYMGVTSIANQLKDKTDYIISFSQCIFS